MKLSFLKKRTANQLKKNKAVRKSTDYKKAETIGILFSVEDRKKHDDVKELIHKLQQDGKKVQVLEFLPEKKENYEVMFDFFTLKDISFWGKIESAKTLKFADTAFDYLFCLDTKLNPMTAYVLARSKSKCRVGKFNENAKSLFEFMIDSNGSTKSLIDGMYKYTTQLR
ncbi:MAG TPA: hypothetical protein VFM90_04875 [Cyclobacteriaceae bacterium]|nr:hypothetical protein [Cyclobacteriaceae bacterium]